MSSSAAGNYHIIRICCYFARFQLSAFLYSCLAQVIFSQKSSWKSWRFITGPVALLFVKIRTVIHSWHSINSRDVNETLGSETETRPRRLILSPRRDRDLPTLCRDRDETETFKFWVRDETETETLRGRDRDIFRDVGNLGYLK